MPSPKQLAPHAFQKGGPPGPGRPIGARSKLPELALQALGADFSTHGVAVIEEVRRTKPGLYLSLVVSLLPRTMTVEKISPFQDLSDHELELLQQFLTSSRARDVTEVNGTAQPEPDKP